MERQPSKSLRKGFKNCVLPELDLSEELADDWGLSPTKEQEIRGHNYLDHCQAQVDAMIAEKYAIGWEQTPKSSQGGSGRAGKLWEGLRNEVREKAKYLRRLQALEEDEAQLLQQHASSLSSTLNLSSLLNSYSIQMYFLRSTSLTCESNSYEHMLHRTFAAVQRVKDKVASLKHASDTLERKISDCTSTVLALETERQGHQIMMTTYASHIASISNSIRRKIDGK